MFSEKDFNICVHLRCSDLLRVGLYSAGDGDAITTDIDEEVTLVLTGGWVDSVAIESIAHEFHTKYPACTIVYEYLQNYEESLLTRLEDGTGSIDIFLTNNLQEGTKLQPYALELFSQSDALDLSNIHDGLIKNFTYQNSDKDAPPEIYAVPVGAEMRGMFVNKTLLASLNIDVPANLEEFLAACEALKENGYVPIQANPSFAGQHLLYPYICNLIANAEQYEATYARVNSCEEGVSELFREPMQVLYTLMAERYYNYKFVETELGVFTNMSSDATAKAFLNIKMDADGNEYKADDLGTVAFMPSAMSLSETIAKVHADYHSEIAYEFVLAPVSDEGGFAYMSPATGIAVNRNSAH